MGNKRKNKKKNKRPKVRNPLYILARLRPGGPRKDKRRKKEKYKHNYTEEY